MDRVTSLLNQRWWWFASLVVGALVSGLGMTQRLDLVVYDLMTPRVDTATRSLVVAVDEASLAALGRWPWPRDVQARLLERLQAAHVSGVGYAVLFSEPSADPRQETHFAQALRALPSAALAVAPVARPQAAGAIGASVAELRPLDVLADAARLGHVDMEVDADGAVRRLYLRGGVASPRYPALSAALLAAPSPQGQQADRLPGERLPGTWVRDGEVMLPRMLRPVPVWSFVDALSSPAFLAAARDRVVWVGVTAAGLGPEMVSPLFDNRAPMPAVQLHAQAYEVLAAGAQIVPLTAGQSLALVAGLLLLPLLWRHPSRRRWVLLATLVTLAPWAVSAVLLRGFCLWWGPSLASVALSTALVLWLASGSISVAWRLSRTQRAAQSTLEAIGEAVVEIDPQGRVAYLNPAGQRLFGSAPARVQAWEQVLQLMPESAERLEQALARALGEGVILHLEQPLFQQPLDGHPDHPGAQAVALRTTVSPRRAPDGTAEGAVLALSDVSEAVAASRRLDHAATHDALTGLPNRRLLQDRLEQALQRAARTGRAVAVLFVDLDRFKRINDSLGHGAGDAVLKRSAERLQQACRAQDTVARWGGDEFVILLEDLAGRAAVVPLAQKIVQVCIEPMLLDDLELMCSASVGVALYPVDAAEADQVLARADAAMYGAKARGGARFEFASADLNLWTRDRMALETALRESLRDSGLVLHYQPQVRLSDGELVGFEALLRWWRSPEQLLRPADFLAVAEESGLVVELGAWVLDEVARQQAAWAAMGLRIVPVAVNLSARQCLNWRVIDELRRAIERHKVKPQTLKLEITERTAMADAEHAAALFLELKALGTLLSVDDFGAGYSSLSQLKRFPLSEIKIDQSFVRGMLVAADDAAIVRATIALAHELGLPVVAGGVETEAQRDFLRQHHCDVMQGYLTGAPRPAAEVQSLMAPQLVH